MKQTKQIFQSSNKLNKFNLVVLPLLLISCGHSSDSTTNSLQSNKQQLSTSGKDVPGVDLYSLSYDIRKGKQVKEPRTVCFENNAVCITQKIDILGTYTLQQGKTAWIMPDALGMFSVTLDPNKVKGGIKTDNLYANSNGNGVQGYITELDDRDCNQDLAPGGKSCNIRYGYTGVIANDNKTNTNHLILTWTDASGAKKTGDFSFDTYNVLYGIQNISVINMVGGSEVNHLSNLASEYSNDIYFMSSLNNQITLQNVGDADLIKEPEHKLFDISRAQTNKSLTMDDLEFHDPEQPVTCKYSDRVNKKDTCNFNFDYTRKYTKVGDNEILSSQLGRLIFVHYPNPDEPRVNYTHKFILSAGHIIPQEVRRDLNESFELQLSNIHSIPNDTDPAVLSYQLPKTDVKLSVEYNPGFYVPHAVQGDTIYYGVGETAKSLTNTLTFTNNNNTSGDFLANDGNLNTSKLGYKLGSTFYEGDLPDFAPVGGLLIASYWSPVANREVKQVVGTLTTIINEDDDFHQIQNYGDDAKIFSTSYLLKIILPTNPPERVSQEPPFCYKGEYDPYKKILRAKCADYSDWNNWKYTTARLDVSKCKRDAQNRYQITVGDNSDYTAIVPVCMK